MIKINNPTRANFKDKNGAIVSIVEYDGLDSDFIFNAYRVTSYDNEIPSEKELLIYGMVKDNTAHLNFCTDDNKGYINCKSTEDIGFIVNLLISIQKLCRRKFQLDEPTTV